MINKLTLLVDELYDLSVGISPVKRRINVKLICQREKITRNFKEKNIRD